MKMIAALLAWLAAPAAPPPAPPQPAVAADLFAAEVTTSGVWFPVSDTNAADGYVELHPFWMLARARVADFERLAVCESHWGLPSYDDTSATGRFLGPLQFSRTSWEGVGGQGDPRDASWEETVWRGHLLQELQGWRAWPECSLLAGLR